MRLAGLAFVAFALASPALAQPDPAPPAPAAQTAEVPEDVARVLRALRALEAARAAPKPESRTTTRTVTSGSRLLRDEGTGASSVRVSNGCASDTPLTPSCAAN